MAPEDPPALSSHLKWSVQACTKRESPFSCTCSLVESHAVEDHVFDFRCLSLAPALLPSRRPPFLLSFVHFLRHCADRRIPKSGFSASALVSAAVAFSMSCYAGAGTSRCVDLVWRDSIPTNGCRYFCHYTAVVTCAPERVSFAAFFLRLSLLHHVLIYCLTRLQRLHRCRPGQR